MHDLGYDKEEYLPSQEEMAACDARAIAAGTSGSELMERAGLAVFRTLAAELPLRTVGKQVLVLCGPGNNGGDGLVVARLMLENGIRHAVVLASSQKFSSELIEQAGRYVAAGGRIAAYPDAAAVGALQVPAVGRDALRRMGADAACVIDALLGTGQRSAPRGSIAALLGELLDTSAPWAAIDIPTGINGDTGEVYAPAISARLTVTIERPKRGMFQYPGRSLCGRILPVSIGITCGEEIEFRELTAACRTALRPRSPWAHKGDFGRVLVVAGSANMPGAGFLTARAALRAGAGLVTKAQPAAIPADLQTPELIYRLLPDEGAGRFRAGMTALLRDVMSAADAVVVGPGIGTDPDTSRFLEELLTGLEPVVVLDADGLNLLAASGSSWQLPERLIITPHPGEAARLLGMSTAEVQRDRYAAARALSKKYRAIAVLKGAATIIHDGAHGWVSDAANPFMATGGSGDVLAGVIAALSAQGTYPLDAARLGVYVHAFAGALASAASGGLITAGDIIEALPLAFSELV